MVVESGESSEEVSKVVVNFTNGSIFEENFTFLRRVLWGVVVSANSGIKSSSVGKSLLEFAKSFTKSVFLCGFLIKSAKITSTGIMKSTAITHLRAGDTERSSVGERLVSAVFMVSVAVVSVVFAFGVVWVVLGLVSSVSGVDKMARSE